MNFKVGDRVRVKSAEEVRETLNDFDNAGYYHNDIYREMRFASSMYPFCGKEYVIKEVCDNGSYRLVGDSREWNFIERWLELVETSEEHCYVSSFTDVPQERVFINKVVGLEGDAEVCLDTECSECSRDECMLYDLIHAIKEYRGIKND